MAVRNRVDREAWKKTSEQFGKSVSKIYLLWLAGIAVGVIGLKLDKIEISNVSFHVEKPEVIQGLFFVAVLIFYFGLFLAMIAVGFMYGTFDTDMNRRMLYLSMGSRKTLQGWNARQIAVIKTMARGLKRVVMYVMLAFLFAPLVQILVFERTPLKSALVEIFSKKS